MGRLGPRASRLPLLGWVRFPSKALLLPHLAVALLAGRGADRLRLNQAWDRAMRAGTILGALGLALALGVRTSGAGLAAWASIVPARYGPVRAFVARGFLASGLLALFVVFVGWAVRRGRVRASLGMTAIAVALVADLVRAGAGMNPQVTPSFFAPLPEMAALHLSEAEGGRVFSYGLDHSPAFREFLGREAPARSLASFYVNRQILAPYNNVVDRVEAAEATDLTSFVPRSRELGPEDYDPQRASALVPWLRNAAVTRVLSLDPLVAPDLVPLAEVPLGPPGLVVHVYRVAGAWPRAFVACRVVPAKDREDALAEPYQAGFDPGRDMAIEGAARRPWVSRRVRTGRSSAWRDARTRSVFGSSSKGPATW